MRPSTSVDKRHNGLTKTNGYIISATKLTAETQATLRKIFCFFLPTHILRLESAVWLLIAINLFAPQADSRPKQTKSLQWLTHVGFCKTILAIPKQSTFIFESTKAKINKLCCLRTAILRPP